MARFQGEIDDDGRMVWYEPRRVAEFTRGLRNQQVTVDITKRAQLHSAAQRGFYRSAILTAMADKTGYETEECHEILKAMFLAVEKDGHRYSRSTATLSKEDFSVYIDRCVRWLAQELEVVIEGA